MGGVLTHAIIGIFSGAVVYYFWRKPEFFFATLVGNTVVDFFKFFFAAVKQGSLRIFSIKHDSTFWFWADLTNNWANWFALGFFALTLIIFLYHHHVIRKKTFWEYDELIWAFLIGVVIHLIIDLLVFEQNAWI